MWILLITHYIIFYFCFSATVANLQSKVETLTTTNALMKEDLCIAKKTMVQLVEENNQLKHALGEFDIDTQSYLCSRLRDCLRMLNP